MNDRIELRNINILIGANGSGKSKLLSTILKENWGKDFQSYNVKNLRHTVYNNDFCHLNGDFGNLPAFLFEMNRGDKNHFKMIEKTIQSIAPFFDCFNIKPTREITKNSDGKLGREFKFSWIEKGSRESFDESYLSDGTLRFICLAAALLQPFPPTAIIIDEPELGLHTFAIDKLAAMIQSASTKTKIIIATQSVDLLNNFNPEDIIVVEREGNQSKFKRLSSDTLKEWLKDYTIGDLWNKNVIGGRP